MRVRELCRAFVSSLRGVSVGFVKNADSLKAMLER